MNSTFKKDFDNSTRIVALLENGTDYLTACTCTDTCNVPQTFTQLLLPLTRGEQNIRNGARHADTQHRLLESIPVVSAVFCIHPIV